MPPRICSKDDCPTQNVSRDRTVNCHRCKCHIHLSCYGIDKATVEIFVTGNIVILCDACLDTEFEEPSPKRKGNAPNMVQRTLDTNLSLSTPSIESSKITTVKPSTQKLIESLSVEVKMQTATIAALKSSVDSMYGTIAQQNENEQKSMGLNNEHMSSIKKSLSETQDLIESIKKPSYADIAKRSQRQQSDGTPKSSRVNQPKKTPKVNEPKKTPALSGTAQKVIGKPLSPIQQQDPKRKMERKTAQKAIWISKLHRDTSADEVLAYIKDHLGINVDQLVVRKLVKKDRDISEYSFVSFCITCPTTLFDILMDVNNWPSNSQLREFKLSYSTSKGVRLNEKSPSKNLQETSHVNQQTPQQVPQTDPSLNAQTEMDTSQVTH